MAFTVKLSDVLGKTRRPCQWDMKFKNLYNAKGEMVGLTIKCQSWTNHDTKQKLDVYNITEKDTLSLRVNHI